MTFYNPNAIEPDYEDQYYCPECGAELASSSKVYVDECGRVIGCEDCIDEWFAEDKLEANV